MTGGGMKSPVYPPDANRPWAQDHVPFNDAFQLPNFPGPWVILGTVMGETLRRNSLSFQAHIEDLHLKYCIPRENAPNTTSGRNAYLPIFTNPVKKTLPYDK
jgi:hypothetical protein